MGSCSALGCKNRTLNAPKGVTFHRFPSDPQQRAKWIAATGRTGWNPTSNCCICSVHFNEEDLDRTSLFCVRVREGSVPSLYPPASSESTSRKRKNASESKGEDADQGTAVPQSANTAADDAANIRIISSFSLAPSGTNAAQNLTASSLAHPQGDALNRNQSVMKMWNPSRLQSILKNAAVRNNSDTCGKSDGRKASAGDAVSTTTQKSNETQQGKRRHVVNNVQFPEEPNMLQPSGADMCGVSGDVAAGSATLSAITVDEGAESGATNGDSPQLLCTDIGCEREIGSVTTKAAVDNSSSAVPLHLVDHADLCRKTSSRVVRNKSKLCTFKPSTTDTRSKAFLLSLPQILPKPLPRSSSVPLRRSTMPLLQQSLQQPSSQAAQKTSLQATVQHTLQTSLPQTTLQTSAPVLPPAEPQRSPQTIEQSSHKLPQVPPEGVPRHVSHPVQQTVPQSVIIVSNSRVKYHGTSPEVPTPAIASPGDRPPGAALRECDTRLTCNHFDEIMELRSHIQQLRNLYLKTKKKNKALGQSVRRLRATKEKLKKTIKDIEKHPRMVDHAESLEGDAKAGAELLKRHQVKLNGDVVPSEYTPELRAFATALHGCSFKAYEYVRKVFSDCLPHASTVQKWKRPSRETQDASIIEQVASEGCNDIGNEGTTIPVIVLRNSTPVAGDVQVEVMQLIGEVV
ncbi:peroxynitrite isomerase THAP4-like [Ornithodoros turicata]|uniref:peroxynitrite isomerase THAP4-like n=1 Tax=Ornithodoros turicata TaxID=34597 RepID=UPI003138FD96